MRKVIVILGFLVLLTIGFMFIRSVPRDDDGMYRCPDGSMVPSRSLCQDSQDEEDSGFSHDITQNETGLESIGTTHNIDSEEDVKDAFTAYVNKEGLDYSFSSAKVYQKKDGITYYKVFYRYHEVSGGRGMLIIASDGTVYRQEMLV